MKSLPFFLSTLALLVSLIPSPAADAPAPESPKPNTDTTTTAPAKKARRDQKELAATLAKRIPTVFPEFDYTPNITYKKVGEKALQLDLLTPKDLKAAAAPLLIYIHGGGWGGGDRYRMVREDVSGVFHRCAKAGIICGSLEYRLNNDKATAFDSAGDCKDALRFLVKHAAEHHIDPTRIGTIGGSAGGHLSLVTALGDPKDFPGDPALAGNDPASIRCEIAYYPATDFTDNALAARFLGPRAKIMFGGPVEEKTEVIRLLSPVALIKKTSTPVYCFHGDADKTLPVENSRRLYEKGKAVGADIQYTEVKNGGHGFSGDCTPTVPEICDKAAQFAIERLTK